MNKWVSNFMLAIRKFYGTENLAFLYSELLQELEGTAEEPGLIHKGNNAEYSSCDFERIVNSQWILSPRGQWTSIQMYVMDGVLYFAKLVVFGRHTCDHNCVITSEDFGGGCIKVIESNCLHAKSKVVRRPTSFDIRSSNHRIYVLLEFQEIIPPEPVDDNTNRKLKFKELSDRAKAPVRATKGSVGYDLYLAVFKSIPPQGCEAVATDITIIAPPSLYPRMAPCSNIVLKNTDIGAVVVDLDYRGNVKVVIMNHNTDNHLHIKPGDRMAQFILTRFETSEVVEVIDVDATSRGDKGFGRTGK